MPRKSALLLLAAVVIGAVQPLTAARDAGWPFRSLPKPGGTIIIVSPPAIVAVPGAGNQPPDSIESTNLPTGEYVAPKDLTIKLADTDDKSFKLRGEVWLDGPSPTLKYPGDEPAGFALFLREVEGLQRYEANSSFMRAKRRLLRGLPQTKIVHVATLPDFPLHTWIPFSLMATGKNISFSFGGFDGEIPGPLDTDGINEIALVAGTKIRNVQVDILGDARNADEWGHYPQK